MFASASIAAAARATALAAFTAITLFVPSAHAQTMDCRADAAGAADERVGVYLPAMDLGELRAELADAVGDFRNGLADELARSRWDVYDDAARADVDIELQLSGAMQRSPAGRREWRLTTTATPRVRLTGRQMPGFSQTLSNAFAVPERCDAACLRETVREALQNVGRELGAAINCSLVDHAFPYAVRIEGAGAFALFGVDESRALLDRVLALDGYDRRSWERIRTEDAREWLHLRRNVTVAFDGRFSRERLVRLFDDSDFLVSQRGRDVYLVREQERIPFLPLYGATLAALLVALYLLWFFYQRASAGAVLRGHVERGEATQGDAYLAQLSMPGVPAPARWQQWGQDFRTRRERAERAVAEARTLLGDPRLLDDPRVFDGLDSDAAISERLEAVEAKLDTALQDDADCDAARSLKAALPTLRTGLEELARARALRDDDPRAAIERAKQALRGCSELSAIGEAIITHASAALRSSRLAEVMAELPAVVEDGRRWRAAALADEALMLSAHVPSSSDVRAQASALRTRALEGLRGPQRARIAAPSGTLVVRIGREFSIGQRSRSQPADVEMGYTQIHRGPKQNRLELGADGVRIVDLGGGNGSFLDDTLLEAGQSYPLPAAGATLALGGARAPTGRGLCRLVLTRGAGRGEAVFAAIDAAQLAFAAPEQLERWPSRDADVATRWLLLAPNGSMPLSLGDDGVLRPATEETADFVLAADPERGLVIAPSAQGGFVVGGESVLGPVPFTAEAPIEVCGRLLTLTAEDAP